MLWFWDQIKQTIFFSFLLNMKISKSQQQQQLNHQQPSSTMISSIMSYSSMMNYYPSSSSISSSNKTKNSSLISRTTTTNRTTQMAMAFLLLLICAQIVTSAPAYDLESKWKIFFPFFGNYRIILQTKKGKPEKNFTVWSHYTLNLFMHLFISFIMKHHHHYNDDDDDEDHLDLLVLVCVSLVSKIFVCLFGWLIDSQFNYNKVKHHHWWIPMNWWHFLGYHNYIAIESTVLSIIIFCRTLNKRKKLIHFFLVKQNKNKNKN